MIYVALILIVAVIALLLLRLRVRFVFDKESRLLFVGVGRTGREFDFINDVGFIRLWGVRVKRFDIEQADKKEKVTKTVKVKKSARRSLADVARALRRSAGPAWRRMVNLSHAVGGDILHGRIKGGMVTPVFSYVVGLVKAVSVEELQGRVEAGFDAPDVTGTVFGYYQAALAAAPQVIGRVQFVPDWSGASFSGAGRIAVALPLYKLVGRTLQLVWRLPLRDMIKLAIGKKEKGESDDQQQRRRDTQGRSQRAA